MKSIFEKWKNIFKKNKKQRLREEEETVDYDPVSREDDAKPIPRTPLRRRSKSVPKLFNESNSPKANIFIKNEPAIWQNSPKRSQTVRAPTPLNRCAKKAQRRASMQELPKTGMFKFAKLAHIPENYHQLRHSVTNVELLDSPSSSPKRALEIIKEKNTRCMSNKTSSTTIYSSISMLDLSYLTESSGVIEKFELSPTLLRKYNSRVSGDKRRPSQVSEDDGVVI